MKRLNNCSRGLGMTGQKMIRMSGFLMQVQRHLKDHLLRHTKVSLYKIMFFEQLVLNLLIYQKVVLKKTLRLFP
jgi:hypothetical protein